MRSFPSRLNFARREQAACSALNSDGISAISDAVILWNVGAALDQSQRQLGTPATGRKGFTGDTIAVTAGSQILDGTPAVCPMNAGRSDRSPPSATKPERCRVLL